jgi:hypothetical protein
MLTVYIDSLESKDINVSNDGPRVCAWDNKSIARVIEQDTRPDRSFGMLPVSLHDHTLFTFLFYFQVYFSEVFDEYIFFCDF